ncbi:hypothetical protein RR48_04980 [Papilio machaon]|uniref:Uncharacterized protein n=1 Tax=Papilio machaon TaxID=76193 RepID=A0A0N1PH63_PAPMA|nr:hypothetical protein RR48_04980 [Papilio machaon]
MSIKSILLLITLSLVAFCNGALSEHNDVIEGRGKKKKIALYVYWADIIVKKIFVLKLIYAFVFFVVIHKAGYFLSWFISYLKEQKRDHHEYHHIPHHHYDYGPPSSYGPHSSYGPPSSYGGPYRRESHGV